MFIATVERADKISSFPIVKYINGCIYVCKYIVDIHMPRIIEIDKGKFVIIACIPLGDSVNRSSKIFVQLAVFDVSWSMSKLHSVRNLAELNSKNVKGIFFT